MLAMRCTRPTVFTRHVTRQSKHVGGKSLLKSSEMFLINWEIADLSFINMSNWNTLSLMGQR